MARETTLQYKEQYLKRLEKYNSRDIEVKTEVSGLGDRITSPNQEESKTLEDALQEAFNMIKENNEKLLEMRNA